MLLLITTNCHAVAC